MAKKWQQLHPRDLVIYNDLLAEIKMHRTSLKNVSNLFSDYEQQQFGFKCKIEALIQFGVNAFGFTRNEILDALK